MAQKFGKLLQKCPRPVLSREKLMLLVNYCLMGENHGINHEILKIINNFFDNNKLNIDNEYQIQLAEYLSNCDIFGYLFEFIRLSNTKNIELSIQIVTQMSM